MKSETIVVNVLALLVTHELKAHLSESKYNALLTDASNHDSIKLCPVLVRYFLPHEGVQVKIVEFQEQPGETLNILVDNLKRLLTKKWIDVKNYGVLWRQY